MSSSTSTRGADAVMQALAGAGVRRIFTLSGNHIMPLFDAALDVGIELFHTRHEAAAVHMADAWSRVTGQVGVAMVTGGPGHANAVAALFTAQLAEAPLLLLSGHAPVSQHDMGAFQEMAQADVARPLCKSAWTSQAAAGLAADIERAIAAAAAGRPGPVHLSLPSDLLEAPHAAPDPAASAVPTPPDGQPISATDAQAIADALRDAQRPLILVGPSSLTRRGQERIAPLQRASGIPVVGMESPRGVADPSLGAFAEMLAQADAVLLLGKRLDFTLKFGAAPALAAEAAFWQIDPDAHELARAQRLLGPRLQRAVQADVAPTIDILTRAFDGQVGAASDWAERVRTAIAYRPSAWDQAASGTAGRLHPVQMLRPLQALLDSHPDAVLVSDGGEIGQWAQACLTAPHRVINGIAGAIGSALPYAAAAQMAVGDAPVIAVLGDGTFGFHAAEIDTAVRYGLPYLAVVGNDARWNAEYQIQLREYGAARAHGCELLSSRYDAVAAAFGGHGEGVSDPAQMAPAIDRARASGQTACLNVMIEGLPAPTVRRTPNGV